MIPLKQDQKKLHYEKMNALMKEFEIKYKIGSKGVGEYLVSLFDIPISPKSYGKPSLNMLPWQYNEHFVRYEGSSQDKNMKADENKRIKNIDISSHLFGKGYELMEKMGYSGTRALGKGKGIVEPMKTTSRANKLKIVLGYMEQQVERLPIYSSMEPFQNSKSLGNFC